MCRFVMILKCFTISRVGGGGWGGGGGKREMVLNTSCDSNILRNDTESFGHLTFPLILNNSNDL